MVLGDEESDAGDLKWGLDSIDAERFDAGFLDIIGGGGGGIAGGVVAVVLVLSGLSSSGRETGVAKRAETPSNMRDMSVSRHWAAQLSQRAVCSEIA
jgi:hypothetical protein